MTQLLSKSQTSSPPRSGGEEGDPLRSNGVGEVVSKKDEIFPLQASRPPHPPALRAGPSLSPRFAGGEGVGTAYAHAFSFPTTPRAPAAGDRCRKTTKCPRNIFGS